MRGDGTGDRWFLAWRFEVVEVYQTRLQNGGRFHVRARGGREVWVQEGFQAFRTRRDAAAKVRANIAECIADLEGRITYLRRIEPLKPATQLPPEDGEEHWFAVWQRGPEAGSGLFATWDEAPFGGEEFPENGQSGDHPRARQYLEVVQAKSAKEACAVVRRQWKEEA
jgi:hypothetical protein